MSQQGKIQLVFIITAGPELAAEGDRLFADHIGWMKGCHHREGEKALLQYNVSKAPELSDPMDPTSAPTGNTHFILAEVYESPAGIQDHFEQAQGSWGEFGNLMAWMGKCKTTVIPAAEIFNSLW